MSWYFYSYVSKVCLFYEILYSDINLLLQEGVSYRLMQKQLHVFSSFFQIQALATTIKMKIPLFLFLLPGDVELAFSLVQQSDGLARTRELARTHCAEAVAAVEALADSKHKFALITLTERVLDRKK